MTSLATALDKAQLDYMVIGGQAVLRHGRVRFTEDIDLTLALSPFDSARVTALLPTLGLRPK